MNARALSFIWKLAAQPPADLPQAERGRLRRRRELFLAGAAMCLALVLTWFLFHLYDTGSALFITVFSLNFLLLLAVALVVVRNILKLLLERKHGVVGSRLRIRLTLACIGLTFAPCVLMFLITTKFVQLSVDFWFKSQVTTTMETALDVARVDYEKTGARLQLGAQKIAAYVTGLGVAWNGQAIHAYLARWQESERLPLLGVLPPDKAAPGLHANPDALPAWHTARISLNWDAIRRQGFQAVLETGATEDYVIGALAINRGNDGYLIIADTMGIGYKAKLDRIALGASEYKQLWSMKRAMKWMLYIGLGVLTLLIVLGAIWFGFRVAKDISSPVLALSEAAEQIAKGDLSVRLSDHADDELGLLIRSFNRMAADIEASRERLTNANILLGEQNLEIAQHSQYIKTVLDNITSGVMSLDREGRITMANKAACSILATPPRNLVGHFLPALLPADMAGDARAMFSRFQLRPLSRWQREITLTIGGQTRRILVNAVGLITPEGQSRGIVAVFNDVSEQERMQRVAAWREVARRIAHEIKNPLTPIKLSAQRLQRKFGDSTDDPVFGQSTSLIVREVEALQEMVQEFSAFAKLPEVNPAPGDILPLLRETTELFRTSHPHITWECSLPDALPVLPLDKQALHRVFMNIFANATEAVADRGDNAAPDNDAPAPVIRVRAAADQELGLVRIDIEDNGRGLSDVEHSRLFEPYFSQKKDGTGLGLTIVKSIINDHKGYVRAGVSPLGGAGIIIDLPFV